MQVLTYGLQVTVIGMLVVFVGLCILIACVKLLQLTIGSRKAEAKPVKAAAAAPVPSVPVASAPAAAASNSAELLAVITAAVAAMMESEAPGTGFVVRSIRRVQSAPVWQRAGREEQIYSRL